MRAAVRLVPLLALAACTATPAPLPPAAVRVVPDLQPRYAGVELITGEPLESNLTEPGGSRLRMLELYQQVQQERDTYRLELEALREERQRTEERQLSLEKRQATLRLAQEMLEAEVRKLQDQGRDLAARLTTARIREFEAVKARLETAIQRARTAPGKQ